MLSNNVLLKDMDAKQWFVIMLVKDRLQTKNIWNNTGVRMM